MHDPFDASLRELIQLPLPCPPMLLEALGCPGDYRLVAYHQCEPLGGVIWHGGMFMHRGMNRDAWQLFMESSAFQRSIPPRLGTACLGTSQEEGTHMLLVDRETLALYIGTWDQALKALRTQYDPAFPRPTPEMTRAHEAFLETYSKYADLGRAAGTEALRRWIRDQEKPEVL